MVNARSLLALAGVALYALHQDVWFWRTAYPLAYHAAYCVAAALLMWALTRLAWPRHLEADAAWPRDVEEEPRR
jgi:hypothetical protein